MKYIFDNWKTTVAGLLILVLAIAFLMGKIDLKEFLAAFAAATGVGNVLSKDA